MFCKSFVSPAAVEVAELKDYEQLWCAEGDYRDMLTTQNARITLDRVADVGTGLHPKLITTLGHLGDLMMQHAGIDSAEDVSVTVRSGTYDTKSHMTWHYDNDRTGLHPTPAKGTYIFASALVTDVRVGRVRYDRRQMGLIRALEGLSALAFANRHDLQGLAAEVGIELLDVSATDAMPLKPGVLYKLPELCVHRTPQITHPIPRNFFRFKDMRP